MSKIVIDENRCKGCGLCTMACPFDLIRIADHFNAKGYRPAEYIEQTSNTRQCSKDADSNNRQCTGCANCATMCPDVAIVVYRTQSVRRTQRVRRERPRADKLVTEPAILPRQASQTIDRRGYTASRADRGRSPGNRGNGREQQNIQSATGERRP